MQLKGENWATGVVALEWLNTIVQALALIFYVKYLGDHPELSSNIGLYPTTVVIWTALGSVAYLILYIFLSALLTRGISQKCTRHLSVWVIIQYILFVISFIVVIANVIGYLGYGWLWWSFVVSLVYRFFILKVISDFNHRLSLEQDKERQKSLPEFPHSEPSEASVKLTENNLQHHQKQYVPLPKQYLPREYSERQQEHFSQPTGYSPEQPLSAISLAQPYHPQPPSLFPPRIGRSYSESTV